MKNQCKLCSYNHHNTVALLIENFHTQYTKFMHFLICTLEFIKYSFLLLNRTITNHKIFNFKCNNENSSNLHQNSLEFRNAFATLPLFVLTIFLNYRFSQMLLIILYLEFLIIEGFSLIIFRNHLNLLLFEKFNYFNRFDSSSC